jgi:8-oxo-dGTP pyrophosphatase MutT (NUDIX family)
MRVREDAIIRADGSPGIYGVVEKPDFALIVPVEVDGLWLVEQYRYPVGGRYLEFPQGSWEDQPQVDPAELAAAELREETGLRAGRLDHLGRLFAAYGYSTQGCQVWVATELSTGPRVLLVEEQDLVARRVGFDEWVELLTSGAIQDVNTLAAWALLCARPPKGLVLPDTASFGGSMHIRR